jgi:2-oxoglutarate dehydrogenase E1 component
VLLLPHGYEGQGAEHSSARIERFLQLCAGNNMIVANPTTPAQMFHLLRRQIKQVFRKPLIIFTPKSLLRHPKCVSSVDVLCTGTFLEVYSDDTDPGSVQLVLICSGKIYYDLLEERDKRGRTDTKLIRIEQLYPFRDDLLIEKLAQLPRQCRYVWVQEEPENMGAWQHLRLKLEELCGFIRFVGRPADSCPAVGSHHLHQQQQTEIIARAFEV